MGFASTLFHFLAANSTPNKCEAFNYLVEAAVESGDIDIRDIVGRTPLMYAASNLNEMTFTALLKHGANPHLMDYSGYVHFSNTCNTIFFVHWY